MKATLARGLRALAVVTSTTALLLPAVAASADPAEQADDRAHEAAAAGEEREARSDGDATERREARSDGDTSDRRPSQHDGEVTEDDDPFDNDGEDRPNTPDARGDEDNRHPSGRDRSAEPGNGGNQGRAQHDPDDDGNGPDRSNGGLDQPGGQGGEDLDDQDGNHGCGNDDDFEDDNEGWCGRPPEGDVDTTTITPSGVAGVVVVVHEEREGTVAIAGDVAVADAETAVLGVTLTAEPAAPESGVLGSVAAVTDVMGAAAAEVSTAGELPRTGAGLAGLAAIGLSALAGGTALSRRRP